MSRPLLLDLYCCEGGSAAGYQAAGFKVFGVDDSPQPRYPGDGFLCADVTTLGPDFFAFFDAIHASPPCQFATDMNNDKSRHLNLIPWTRHALKRSGKPYVIENVRRAREHLVNPVSLFGTMFDCHMVTSAGQRFDLSRERLFETNWPLVAPADPGPRFPIANVFGGHVRARSGGYRTGKGTGKTVDFPGENRPALAMALTGMPWATMNGMSEAVPPVMAQEVGRQLLAHLGERT